MTKSETVRKVGDGEKTGKEQVTLSPGISAKFHQSG